jgi:predicted Zn-dependent protease
MNELALADQVLDRVRRTAGPHVQTEVVVHHGTLSLTRFANSAIHQNVTDATTTVRLRLHLDGRTAGGSTTVLHADGLQSLVDRTVAASRLSPPDAAWAGLTAPAPLIHPDADVDEATAAATPEDRALRVRDFVQAAEGLETAGFCRTLYSSAAFANTAGQAVQGRAVEAAMDGIARCGGVDGVARLAESRLSDLDGTVLGRRAAAKAHAARQPVELPPGRYEVVLEPDAAADLLSILTLFSFNGRDVVHGQSCVEVGAAQFDSQVTIIDDPFPGAATALPFDDEGTPRTPLLLVSEGVSTGVTHDRTSAAGAGTTSTGHASPTSRSWGPTATHPRMLPGRPAGSWAPSPDGPVAASARPLVAAMRRGLLITDLWYTRVLDKKTMVMTGLTRNGVWLVENGEIVAPVSNMRFTQSYLDALAPGGVLGIGAESVPTPDPWHGHRYTAPALHLASWNFTGNASG